MHATRTAPTHAPGPFLAARCSWRALRLVIAAGFLLAAAAASAHPQDLVQLAVASGRLSESAGPGSGIDFAELRAQRDVITRSLEALDRAAGQGPKRERVAREDHVQRLQRAWRSVAEATDRLLGLELQVADANEHGARISALVPVMQVRLDELARNLGEGKDASKQGYMLNRQILLQERMTRFIGEMLAGGPTAITSADRLHRDMALLTRVQEGLSRGNPELGIAAIESEAAQTMSRELLEQLAVQAESVNTLVNELAYDLWSAHELSAQIRIDVQQFQQHLLELAGAWH